MFVKHEKKFKKSKKTYIVINSEGICVELEKTHNTTILVFILSKYLDVLVNDWAVKYYF